MDSIWTHICHKRSVANRCVTCHRARLTSQGHHFSKIAGFNCVYFVYLRLVNLPECTQGKTWSCCHALVFLRYLVVLPHWRLFAVFCRCLKYEHLHSTNRLCCNARACPPEEFDTKNVRAPIAPNPQNMPFLTTIAGFIRVRFTAVRSFREKGG